MSPEGRTYFASDVHLGLRTGDPAERERRFLSFLKSIPREGTDALYLLGDIWDFWYEYRYVVPKEGARVVAQLIDLVDSGVDVFFMPGNHDIWCFSFFGELGIKMIHQPCYARIGGKVFCLGHGDGLGGAKWSYRFLQGVFHNRILQRLFSAIHPTLAFGMGNGWSKRNRGTHPEYVWKRSEEPLYKYAVAQSEARKADFYIFGHYHVRAEEALPDGSTLVVLKDWIGGGTPYAVFENGTLTVSE